jgi:hypothetical protein
MNRGRTSADDRFDGSSASQPGCLVMARSVHVEGRPLTWTRLVQLLGDGARLSPISFDVAKDMSLLQAQQLHAWLTRRRIACEIVAPARAEGSAGRRRRTRGTGTDGQ